MISTIRTPSATAAILTHNPHLTYRPPEPRPLCAVQFDFDHLLTVIDQLKSAGTQPVAVPTYDFVTHSRLSSEHDTHINAPQIVIVEGTLAL